MKLQAIRMKMKSYKQLRGKTKTFQKDLQKISKYLETKEHISK